MARKFKSMDGNNAAAHVSYAFSEPNTPPTSTCANMRASGRQAQASDTTI